MQDSPPHPGEIWREIIEEAGVTQAWVAGQMGITQKHLNQIVNGRARPSAEHTVEFARIMAADPVKIYVAQAEIEIARAASSVKERRATKPVPPRRWS